MFIDACELFEVCSGKLFRLEPRKAYTPKVE